MSLSRYEQETVILFNEKEKTASIYTNNGALKRKLQGLCESRPEDIRRTKEDQHGGLTFELPKKWIRINASRVLSEAQKDVLNRLHQKHNV